MTVDSRSILSLLEPDRLPADGDQLWGGTSGYWTRIDEDRPEYYWGEIDQADMQRIIAESRENGWQETVNRRVPKALQGMITNVGRSDWLDLLDSAPKTALDVGSGWGQTSFLTAQRFPEAQVMSIEPIRERAEFQALRAEQESVTNLHVLSARLNDAELPNGAFDLCSMIGVLEWVAVNETDPDPRDSQLKVLRRLRQSTRQGGSIIVGIENRLGINNFLGSVDHSGLRFTSLMSRRMANAWCSFREPTYRSSDSVSSYRTYTYSRRGFIELFEDAGYSNIEVWSALPHYAHPRCMVDTTRSNMRESMRAWRPASQRHAVMKYLLDGADRVGLAGELAPYFMIKGSVA